MAVPSPAVAAANGFGFNLFHKLSGGDSDNVVISPTSLMLALAMTYNGAGGETKAAMAEALQLSKIPVADVNAQLSELQRELQTGEPKVKLLLANSLWADDGVAFAPQFLETCERSYRAKARTLDFSSPRALATINDWAEDNTRGLIREILTPADLQAASSLIIDAAYLKGRWSNPFEVGKTNNWEFTLQDGKRKSIAMMKREGEYIYAEDRSLQAIALPYGTGRMNMIVVLPSDEQGLPALREAMDATAWSGLLRTMVKRKGEIKLPRFEVTYDAYVTGALKALGMNLPFSGKADFSPMGEGMPPLGFVKHKSFLRVTEKNTEAAAVTSVATATSRLPGGDGPFLMTVDHPFLLGIVDTKTGALLFLGAINDPKETRAGE
jgi:serpin B